MSLRRFRAERLLNDDFAPMQARVLAAVRSRLGGAARALDAGDLEACYAQAFHGLYAAVVAGEEIANPAGWLVTVTCRRAIEELRLRARETCAGEEVLAEQRCEQDPIERLEAARQLRELCEALRCRLSAREREAATLCYLLGFSRAEAAARMGISERRMRKLMEGDGAGRPGVSGKVGELLALIRADRWCESQGSLMRALALGVLEPGSERYRVARGHERECPRCRRFVAAMRALGAALPPLLPHGALLGGVGVSASLGARAATTKGAAGAGGGSGLLGAGSLAGGSSAVASASSGGVGSLIGSLAVKAAAGALALGAGGAIVAVDLRAHARPGRPHKAATAAALLSAGAGSLPAAAQGSEASASAPAAPPAVAGASEHELAPPSRALSSAAKLSAASSEFGIEALSGAEGAEALPAQGFGTGRREASARLASHAGSDSRSQRVRRAARSGTTGVRATMREGSAESAKPLSGGGQGALAPGAAGAPEGGAAEPVNGAGGPVVSEAAPAQPGEPAGRAAEGEFSFE
ncbi:MAG TPA: sigma-70 family RNA polymerase sigma factor [Solirubrobacteraceae bacterium]|nr:sigma-70 family RNA polymerase sigma factor [Solirubrobacteraceae bacterium]